MNEATLETGEVKMNSTGWQPYGPLGADEQLHFLHIPKTAGRSVRAVLESHFDFAEICPGTVLSDIFSLPPSDLDRWRLFCGHYGRYINRLLKRPSVEITFLRDPIARSVSHYHDLQNRPGLRLHEFVKTHTFDEFVMHPGADAALMNLQTRFLAFDDIDEDYFGHSRLRVKDMSALSAKYSDPALLEKAVEGLDAQAFVGLQERFDESISLLAATFGWAPPREVPRRNTAKKRFDHASISPQAMDRLRAITAFDQELYDFAVARFEAQATCLNPARIDAVYSASMASRPRISEMRLGFDQAFEGAGWYGRQRAPDGIVRRWTGPGTVASMDLPLDITQTLRLRFKASAQAKDVIRGVRVVLNGVELTMKSWPTADPETAERAFDVVLPREAMVLGPQFARIEFHLPRTICPAEQSVQKQDSRHLGLNFEWLEINTHQP